MVKLISWNIAGRVEPWRELLRSDADVALLQEAAAPPPDVKERLDLNDEPPWCSAGGRPWRTAVVALSDRVKIKALPLTPIGDALCGDLAVSRVGTLAAAEIYPLGSEPFTVISLYAVWEKPLTSTGSSWIYADASVHRLISDLSVLIGKQSGHRIIASGDLNILHGYGENGSPYWKGRYVTVFDRMVALGLAFVGPQAPAGRQSSPWPAELPAGSKNVPTYHTNQQTPSTATRQLDFVFASEGFATRVRAVNDPAKWGPSDHSRLEICVTG